MLESSPVIEAAPAAESVMSNTSRRDVCQSESSNCPADTCKGQNSLFEAGWPRPNPQEPCKPSYAARACHCSKRVKRRGCCRQSCPDCGAVKGPLRIRRKVAIRKRFEKARNGRPLLYTIFTVPPELRHKAADPAVWRRWRKAIWAVLRRKFGGEFACERTDPAGKCKRANESGERCACAKCSRWHPHLNFLWVQRPTGSFRPFIAKDRLAYLGRAWGRIIGATRTVNIRHAYCEPDRDKAGAARAAHWYSYMARVWADWAKAVPGHVNVRWLGKFPRKIDAPKAAYCDKCGHDFVCWRTNSFEEAEYLATLEPRELWVSISNRIIGQRSRDGT